MRVILINRGNLIMDSHTEATNKIAQIQRDKLTETTRHFHHALLEVALKNVALQARSVSQSWGCITSNGKAITPPHNGELLMQKIRIANMKRLFASIESSLPKGIKAKYMRAMDELPVGVCFRLVKFGAFPRHWQVESQTAQM
jgi:hypothetical protein